MSNKKKQVVKKKTSPGMGIIIGVIVALLVAVLAAAAWLAIDEFSLFNKQQNTIDTTKQQNTIDTTGEADMAAIEKEINSLSVDDFKASDTATDYVRMDFQGKGSLVLRLRDDIAPITVENFKGLVGKGFYDNLTIHRVSKGFVIQGGDPEGTGSGGSGVTIKGEFSSNGVRNELSHIKGVISMARQGGKNDSATSQFFICTASTEQDLAKSKASLDGNYAGFGYVVAGLSTVDTIAATPAYNETPTEKIVIEKAYFVTKK